MSQPYVYVSAQRIKENTDLPILLSVSQWPLHFQATISIEHAQHLINSLTTVLRDIEEKPTALVETKK